MASTRRTTLTAIAALSVVAAALIGFTAGNGFPSPASPSSPTSTGARSETLRSPTGSPSPTRYRLPAPATVQPTLLAATLPAPALAKGRLVTGFPTALTLPRGTAVESSSLAVHSGVLQAALVVTGGDPTEILVHFRQLLTARGFVEQRAQGVENAPAAAFVRKKDNVTVTVVKGKAYVLANLRGKGALR